jgi:hypothetical protein
LAALVWTFPDLDGLSSVVPLKLGIDLPYHAIGSPDWVPFIRDCELQDALDFITLGYWHLVDTRRTGFKELKAPERWCVEVQRIFQEENVHYRVDERGGVHFRFDAEFDHNRAVTIASLQGARYRAALKSFEDGMGALAKAPPDGKTAIRNTFDAAEGLFKLMFANAPRLTASEASKLEPLLQRVHATDKAATGAVIKLLSAFKDWIDAAHFYRHEAGLPEPTQPPLTLAVQMVSVGASFIRWLPELDAIP